ncbi:MAG: hypothetical protein AAGC85_14375 [Bacteroidota bacterium]
MFSLVAQPVNEKGINYQAVLSQSGNILANQEVQFRFTLLQKDVVISYQEEHLLTTDDRGRVSTVIGTGKSGFKDFSQVDWTDPELSLQVEVDADESGYKELSNEPLQAVPFSYMANEVLNLPEITLDSLANVSTSGVERGQFLQWSGKSWAPGDDSNPWTEVEQGIISYEGKIGLNNPSPKFDIDSRGEFQHVGPFSIRALSEPALQLASSSSTTGIKLSRTFGLVGSEANIDYSLSGKSLSLKVADVITNTTAGIYLTAGRLESNTGLIGIDEPSPVEKLDVAGAIKIGNTTRSSEGTIRWTGSDFEGRKAGSWVSLTSQAVNSSPSVWSLDQGDGSVSYKSGFVGIGIDEPTQQLSLFEDNNNTDQGQLLLTQAGDGDAMINMGIGNGTHYALGIDNSDGDKFKIGYNSSGVDGIDRFTRLTLQPDGNLGLGTTAPKRKFTISQNHGNTSLLSHLLLEQLGLGDAWMNFIIRSGRSYAMGIDNSDGDSFKIGTSDEGDINGVGEGTLLKLDPSGEMTIGSELNREITGSADLVPVAYGSFLSSGLIDQSKGTRNFSVERLETGIYKITLTNKRQTNNYVIVATTGFVGNPMIVHAQASQNDTFSVVTYELLPTVSRRDTRVNFVIYKP